MKFIIILFLVVGSNGLLYGQTISGTVFEKDSETSIEYVNIGIFGKNIGTVSDQNGKYTLQIKPDYFNDTLVFSCIGYQSYSVKVSDFINLNNGNVRLEKRSYDITEVVVRPKKIKQKTLGITTKNKSIVACIQNSKGYELGVLMSNKTTSFLKEVTINVKACTYDTIFFRINIYKTHEKKQFENILSNPIYVSLSKQEIKDKITIDLRSLNLVVEGDFLVSFEYIKDLGPGSFCFCASLFHKSYGRGTSQGTWDTWPVGISISVDVDVER